MEELIKQEEIKLTINRMNSNMAPGPDGFTVEFSKTFLEKLYNHSLQVKYFPATWNEVVVIFKPDKDQKKVES